jgi:hemerythrin
VGDESLRAFDHCSAQAQAQPETENYRQKSTWSSVPGGMPSTLTQTHRRPGYPLTEVNCAILVQSILLLVMAVFPRIVMNRHSVGSLTDRRHTLGHDIIDGEHSALAECWLRAVSCEQIEFPLRIARLRKLMTRHFDHEVALLAESGGTLCHCHRNEHHVLLELCDRVFSLHERNWRKTQTLLRNKFANLVRKHISTMDQMAVLIINTGLEKSQRSAGGPFTCPR